MIHSDNYIEISIIILFLIREIPQKIYLAQLNAFPPAQMKNLKIYIGKVFSSVQMHLYSKYEVNLSRNKVVGAKKRFCAHVKSLLCANDTLLKNLISPMLLCSCVRIQYRKPLENRLDAFRDLREKHTYTQTVLLY